MSHIIRYHDKKNTKLKEEYIQYGDKCLYKSYYETGELHEECNYINGLKEGNYKSYYKNGRLLKECNYTTDKMNDIYKSYFINGQLEVECNYVNGLKEGSYKSYNMMGM